MTDTRPTGHVPEGRNPIIFEGFVYTKLNDGSVTVCDVQDYSLIKDKIWSKSAKGYAYFTRENPDQSRSSVKMHQLFFPNEERSDHENGDRLDNRRDNLRQCSAQQNTFNRAASKTGTSTYKGVSIDRSRGLWISAIMIDGKTKHLGRFNDEIGAAKAYDAAAKHLHGEFARLNFPVEMELLD